MTDSYAVIGNPVAHSRSPQIHAEFARQTGQDIAYGRLLAPLDAFEATARRFFDGGGKGLNVTVPFKHAAWNMVDSHAGHAMNANAVNTIKCTEGRLAGYNTDGPGLVRDIRDNLHCPLQGKRVLLMGAGGATYGVMEPLLREQPQQLVIVNRTLDKALGLVGHFRALEGTVPDGVSARAYSDLGDARFDIVINATSAGLSDAMPPLP